MALIQGIVDTQKQNLKSLGIVNSGDDLTIELEVKQNGVNIEFVNPIFELLATKSDGTRVRQLVDITYIGNVVNVIGDEQLVTSPGIVTLQLIIKDNKRSSTCLFYFMCGTSLDRDIIQSISKVEVLNQLDEYVVQAFANLKEYEQRIIASDASIRNLNEDMIKAEKVRVQAEINRGDTFDNLVLKMNNAINAAIATDETLQNNETKRIDNYNTLKTELERIKDDLILLNNNISKEEEKRVQAEIYRVNASIKTINTLNTTNDNVADAEAIRVRDWSSIKQENTTLKEALTTINNTANSNEEVRKENEAGRVSAEQKRQNDFETMQQENTTFKEEVKKQYDDIVTENNNFKNQMNTDFGEAKIGYDGTTHNNIVERLNYDFDRIEQKHNESSYLEYSGTSVKADNSYYGLSKDLCIKGRTIQNLMNESVMGISKFTKYSNTTIEDNSDYLTINRGTTELKVSTVLDGTLLKPNTTYTIILSKKDSNTYIQVYDSDSATFLLKPVNSDKVTFTTKNKTNLLYFYFLNINSENVQSIKAYKRATIILEGDYSNTPISEIQYSEGIYSVGEKENNLISVKSCGKNLFNKDKTVNVLENYFVNLQGDIVSARDCLCVRQKVKPNTTYYLSGYYNRNFVRCEDLNNNFIKLFNTINPITTPNNCYYIVWYIGNQEIPNKTTDNVQIEENTILTPYTNYQENKQQFQLTEHLRSLPNGVCDELFGNELIRRVGKLVLNGGENWSLWSQHGNGWRDDKTVVAFAFKLNTANNKKSTSVICDRFVNGGIKYIPDNESETDHVYYTKTKELVHCYYANSETNQFLTISISKTKLGLTQENWGNAINLFKQWLQQNPTTLYYELETPIVSKLDKTVQLGTYNETTHITSDNYLQPNLSVKVPTNVQKVIQNLKVENRSLENELNKSNNLILENAEYNLDNDLRITKYELGL